MAIAVLAATALPATAQTAGQWPERPVRMIVPLGAGGPADLVGRYIAQQLGERFKQSFFIENRPGAAGIIGTAEAAKAAPDGYTLLVIASPHVNLEILGTNKPYRADARFRAGGNDLLNRCGYRGASRGAGEVRDGADCAREVEARRAHLCVVRPGLEQASRRRAVQADERHGHPARRLQGQHRRTQRHHRRTREHDVRRGALGPHPT